MVHTAEFVDKPYAGGIIVRCPEGQFDRWKFGFTLMEPSLLDRRGRLQQHEKYMNEYMKNDSYIPLNIYLRISYILT